MKFNIVGKPVIRPDGYAKVTGKAKFADDYNLPDQLYGVAVRLPVAHAKIKSIDFSEIEKSDEIVTICDWRDVPGKKKIGVIRHDQPVFCYEKIVTPGDVVALLVGKNEAKLRQLAEKVKFDVEELPVLTDPKKALEKDAPLIHPEFESNLIVHHPLRKGDVEKGFQQSEEILEQTYTTSHIEHAYIEPECVLAIPLPEHRGIKVIGSIQNPYTARRFVAMAANLPLNKVRIEQAALGGSFGGKDDMVDILCARAAIAALKTGKPVKIRYQREESIMESYKRHPYIMHYKVGFTRDGKIKAMKIDILADGGAYVSMSPFVTWRTVVQATGPYEVENVWTDVRAVYTNNPYTGAMRGFGSPQPIFAQESIMDEIAIRCGLTPEEIRRINGFREGSVTATGQVLQNHDVNLLKVMSTATEKTDFSRKWRENSGREIQVLELAISNPGTKSKLILNDAQFIEPDELLRKGIGMAVSFRGTSLGAEGIDAAAAYLSVQQDGSAYLLSGLAENGQGMQTTYAIIAAEILGIDVNDIYYLEMDTALVPDSGPTVASRSTLMGGGAVKLAAEKVRKNLTEFLRQYWKLNSSEEIHFENKKVFVESQPEKSLSFSELCQLAYGKGISLAALGWYPGPKVNWDSKVGQGTAYFTYVYGCQIAEVTVNLGTGEVFVDRVVAVHDAGKVINLLGAQGQVYGGVTQGAGYGLWEEITNDNGFIRELNFDQFLIPTARDIGEIEPHFIEGEDEFGPWGAKSLGEPTLELTAAAIANAVRNATGKRFFNQPLNLEEILLGKKLRPRQKRGSLG